MNEHLKVIDNRELEITLYLVPLSSNVGTDYKWSKFDNHGRFAGTAKVVLESLLVNGCSRVKEIVRIKNPMNIKTDLKPGCILFA